MAIEAAAEEITLVTRWVHQHPDKVVGRILSSGNETVWNILLNTAKGEFVKAEVVAVLERLDRLNIDPTLTLAELAQSVGWEPEG